MNEPRVVLAASIPKAAVSWRNLEELIPMDEIPAGAMHENPFIKRVHGTQFNPGIDGCQPSDFNPRMIAALTKFLPQPLLFRGVDSSTCKCEKR
jgi:hypothetical protein